MEQSDQRSETVSMRVRPHNLDYATLTRHLPELGAKRVVLTHMSFDMLVRVAETGCEAAEDGMVLTV